MDGGLLSLKWNNHKSTFFYVLSNVRKKENYTDVTLACDGKFYPVHKLVLSTCSEYFEQMFEQTQCKHPVIVLKDIRCEELESLLSYMYVGEVNVVQEKLSGLIKAAECLRIKGLAVPDEEPCSNTNKSSASSGSTREKRTSDNSISSEPKRRRQDDSASTSNSYSRSNRIDDRRKSLDHPPTNSNSNKFRNSSNSSTNSINNREVDSKSPVVRERLSSPLHGASNSQLPAEVKEEQPPDPEQPDDAHEVTIDEPNEPVKQEPVDLDAVYLSDSNSAAEAKEMMMDSFGDGGDGQQHFMDELLGQNSGSDQGHMNVGDYTEGGEGSSSAPSAGSSQQQQQHMVGGYSDEASSSTTSSSQLLDLIQPPEYTSHQRSGISSLEHMVSNIGQKWNTPIVTPIKLACDYALAPYTMDASGRTSAPNSLQYDTRPEGFLSPDQISSLRGNTARNLLLSSNASSSITVRSSGIRSATDNLLQNAKFDKKPAIPSFDSLDIDKLLTPSKTFKCPICHILTGSASKFREHYMTHASDRLFSCLLCPYQAITERDLIKHVATMHR